MIIHSIKWRLQAWHGFLLLCLVTGLMTGFYAYERRVKLQAVDNELLEAMTPLLPKLEGRGEGERGRRPPPPRGEFEDGQPPRPGDGFRPPEDRRPPPFEREPRISERELRQLESAGIYYIAWRTDGTRSTASTNAPAGVPKPEFASAQPGRMMRTRGKLREVAHLVPSGMYVVVGKSVAAVEAGLRQLALALAAIGGGIVVAGFAGGWWLATRALRPIADISLAAKEIAEGDLAKRINASETESELGQLAAVLNSTFARLDAAFAQQQQFTSDAAHELRTPVSVILTQIQSTLNKERTPAEYRETLEACHRAAQRMRRLIESLLELARFDAGQAQLKQMPFDLAAIARDCADLVEPLAQERSIRISSELQTANCQGDAERIGQVVTNLLTNAVNYNRNGGEVRVATRRNGDSVVLTVTDTGPGIPTEHLPKIFDRFYRVDAARTSAQGRTGLGLAISKLIVEGHGGSLTATNHPDGGAEFAVKLPLR
jgi:heavy metal sensor kinase